MKNKEKSDNQILFFLKFGSEKNMLDLLNSGTIYFNTIDYFQNLEGEKERGDNYEGTTRITNYHEYKNLKVTFKIPNSKKKYCYKTNKITFKRIFN